MNFCDVRAVETVLRQAMQAITTNMIAQAKPSRSQNELAALRDALTFADGLIPALAETVARAALGEAVGAAVQKDPAVSAALKRVGMMTVAVGPKGSLNVHVGAVGGKS